MNNARQTTASVRLWLERLWHQEGSRDAFWKAILLASEPTSSGHARATFSQAVIDLVEGERDLLPLAERVIGEGRELGPAHHALGFICNQAAAEPAHLVAAPWLKLCESVAVTSDPAAITHCSIFLAAFARHGNLDASARPRAAKIARSLLTSSWRSADATASRAALGCAIGIIGVDPSEGALQLMRVLQEREIPDREYAISVLAWDIKNLLKTDEPNVCLLVAALYELVGVDIGGADRRSNEELAAWLARAYEAAGVDVGPAPPHEVSEWAAAASYLDDPPILMAFLRSAPVLATQTLVRVLRSFGDAANRDRVLCVRGRVVPVLGQANWPALPAGFEATVREQLCEEISQRARTEPDIAASMIDVMADEHAPIGTWQALVNASRFSLPLVILLSDLYKSDDAVQLLSAAIASSVRGHGASLPPEVLMSLEQTLMRLDQHGLDARRLIEPALRGEEVEALTGDDDECGDGELNGDADSMKASGDGGQQVSLDRGALRFRGMSDVEIDDPQNVVVQRFEALADASTREIGPDLADKVPAVNVQALDHAKARLRDLRATLYVEGVHAGQRDSGWGTAARLASALARQGDDDVLDVLLAARDRQRPPVDPVASDLLNRFREEAFVACFDGLITLAGRGVPSAIEAVMLAANDDEPAVRFRVANRVRVLVDLPDDCGWRIVESLVRDRHPMVASETTSSFGPFYKRDLARGIALDWAVLESTSGKSAYIGQVNALAHLAWYHLRTGNSTAGDYLGRGMEMVSVLAGPIGQLAHRYRPWLVLGGERAEGPNDAESVAMARTWQMFASIAAAAMRALVADGSVTSEINTQLRSKQPGAAQVIDDVAHQLYFASGAFQDQPKLTPEARKRYWRDASSLLVRLGECGILAAAHSVLETLEHLLECSSDVPWDSVFSMFLRVARSAVGHGYTRDWSGIDLIDQVLRRAATDHPTSFKRPEARAAMSEILDAFLEAGWPKAYLLARDLDLSDSRRTLIR